jgi:hypothetical protein
MFHRFSSEATQQTEPLELALPVRQHTSKAALIRGKPPSQPRIMHGIMYPAAQRTTQHPQSGQPSKASHCQKQANIPPCAPVSRGNPYQRSNAATIHKTTGTMPHKMGTSTHQITTIKPAQAPRARRLPVQWPPHPHTCTPNKDSQGKPPASLSTKASNPCHLQQLQANAEANSQSAETSMQAEKQPSCQHHQQSAHASRSSNTRPHGPCCQHARLQSSTAPSNLTIDKRTIPNLHVFSHKYKTYLTNPNQ